MREIDIEIERAVQLAAHKAAPLFNLFGWTYFDKDQIPDIWKIEKDFHGMIADLRKVNGTCSIRKGRFLVMKEKNEEGTFDYTLSLPLSEIFGLEEEVQPQ